MQNKIILLVEDNPDDEALALRALQKNHILNEVVVARDGAEALDYLFSRDPDSARDPDTLPAITLLDLKLPKVDGLEVLEQIRANPATRYLPVAIFTSSKEEQDLIESYRLGANSYIQKPVDFDRFSGAVKNLGLYWVVMNEVPPGYGR